MPTISPDAHFDRLHRLLELEGEAEARELLEEIRRRPGAEAETLGVALLQLAVHDENVALGGRTLLTLGKRDRSQGLPWNRFQAGAPVVLSDERSGFETGYRGVVASRDERTVTVAFDRSPEFDEDRAPLLRLDLSHDEVSLTRQKRALREAKGAERGRPARLREILLGERPARFTQPWTFRPLDGTLNDSQLEAVRFAMRAEDVAIVHGPPGTGKTTTLVEIARQAAARGDRVLACAPSHTAVDNLFERLLRAGERVVRLGHPARVQEDLRAHTLDLLVDAHPDVKLARRLAREARALRRQASKTTRGRPEPGYRADLRDEARELSAEARRLERQVLEHYLDGARILCCTLAGLDPELLGDRRFDLAIVDEAAQTTEPLCWIAANRADRLVLGGDHRQLPPTVVSVEAARAGFGVSLMERLMEPGGIAGEDGGPPARRLEVQYRMHREIMAFPSTEFYEGGLSAHDSVADRLLRDLPGVRDTERTGAPLLFLDTAGAECGEERDPDGASRHNPGEADIVARKTRELVADGLAPEDIAVVTPYSAQARSLRERLADLIPGLEVDSVDAFQGREKEAVVISLTRSNPEGEIGFLGDVRRMNVALTRARRRLVVVGDSATVASHPFYRRLVEDFERRGAYKTIWEEMEY